MRRRQGCRDAWFEVPLPFFLRDSLVGLGWSRTLTGLFLAVFIIVYGQVQSWSPHFLLGPLGQVPANKYVAVLWAALLAIMPAVMGTLVLSLNAFSNRDIDVMTAVVVVRTAPLARAAPDINTVCALLCDCFRSQHQRAAQYLRRPAVLTIKSLSCS